MARYTSSLLTPATSRNISNYLLKSPAIRSSNECNLGFSGLRSISSDFKPRVFKNWFEKPLLLSEDKLGFSGSCLLSSTRRYYSVDKGREIPKKWFVRHGKLLLALSVCSCITIYFCPQEIIPYTNRAHFLMISPEREKILGEIKFKHLKEVQLGSIILSENHPITIRVNSIAQKLIAALEDGRTSTGTRHLEDLNWEVIVIDSSLPGAWCLPSGKIVVCTGTLELFLSDHEIAAYIAHQIGHVVARHMIEQMTKEWWKTIVTFTLPNDVADKMTFLTLKPYSLEVEMEANYIGLVLLANAGYSPYAAIRAYEKLRELSLNDPTVNHLCIMRYQNDSQTYGMEKAMELYKARASGLSKSKV